MHTSTTQPGIVPHRPGPPAQGASFPSAHFTPRPMFHPNDPLQRQQAPIPMSVTASMPMNLSASSSANPTPFSQPPQVRKTGYVCPIVQVILPANKFIQPN